MHTPAPVARGLDHVAVDEPDRLSDDQLRERIERDATELKRRQQQPADREADRLPSRPLG